MPNTYHVATVNAFKSKKGDYVGAVRNEWTGEITRERFTTYDEARNWVRSWAYKTFGPVNYASMPRKDEYYANIWATR